MNGQGLYRVYAAACPRCSNTENNRDHGPYGYHPLDDWLGGPPGPNVHLMSCGGCGKTFDAGPLPDTQIAERSSMSSDDGARGRINGEGNAPGAVSPAAATPPVSQVLRDVLRRTGAASTPLVRQQCERCGGETFAIYYDPTAQGCHVECEDCGEVFLGI